MQLTRIARIGPLTIQVHDDLFAQSYVEGHNAFLAEQATPLTDEQLAHRLQQVMGDEAFPATANAGYIVGWVAAFLKRPQTLAAKRSQEPGTLCVGTTVSDPQAIALRELVQQWGYRDITELIRRFQEPEPLEYTAVLQSPEGGPVYCRQAARLYKELDTARAAGRRYDHCPAPDPAQHLWMVVGNFECDEDQEAQHRQGGCHHEM